MNETTETFPSVARMRPYFAAVQSEIASKTELKSLRELQGEFDALQGQLSRFGTAQARIVARSNREKVLKDPETKLELSKERIAIEHRERRRILKAALRDLSAQRILPAVEPIFEKALSAVNAFATELEGREQAEASRVEVPFEPSKTLLAVKDKIRVMRENLAAVQSRDFTGSSPRGLLEGILEF